MGQQLKTHFKTPEGKYSLVTERAAGSVVLHPSKPCRLALAQLNDGGESCAYILFSLADHLLIFNYPVIHKVAARDVQFSLVSSVNGQHICILSHDYHPSPDDMDIVVGLNTGEVFVGSLKLQMDGSPSNHKLLSPITFNSDGSIDSTPCTSVAWLPRSGAASFAAGYASGNIYIYTKSNPNGIGSVSSRFSLKPNGGEVARSPTMALPVSSRGITAVKASPDGDYLAVTGRDGILRILDTSTGTVITGFKSYFGGLLCCGWSPDGNYVAAGGEDDLVSVFGVQERCVVAWAEGHSSWVTSVAFDPWVTGREDMGVQSPVSTSGRDSVYRLASVGQDCQMLLHDIVIIAEDYLAGLPPLSPKASALKGSASRRKESSATRDASPLGGRGSITGPDAPAHSHRRSLSNLPVEICPPASRKEMIFTPPIMTLLAHSEPMSDVMFTPDAVFTACQGAAIKFWRRPPPVAPLSPITNRCMQMSIDPPSMSL